MPNTENPSLEVGKARRLVHTLARAFTAMLFCLVAYFLLVALLTLTRMNGTPLINRLIPLAEPGGVGFSLQRFREAEQIGQVDIVFIGPSSCYRSFDPRMYRERELTSMNLGSTAQCPVTAFYILTKYLDDLQPKLVVLDISQMALAIDGMESLADFASNLPIDRHVIGMTASVGEITAVNLALAAALRNWQRPLEEIDQGPVEYDTYIPGGFLETTKPYGEHQWADGVTFPIQEKQWDYLRRMIDLLRERGIPVAAVSMPMTRSAFDKVADYEANHDRISSFMAANAVPYFDLNYALRLDDRMDFIDELHLSNAGVGTANQFLLQWLEKTGHLPELSKIDQ